MLIKNNDEPIDKNTAKQRYSSEYSEKKKLKLELKEERAKRDALQEENNQLKQAMQPIDEQLSPMISYVMNREIDGSRSQPLRKFEIIKKVSNDDENELEILKLDQE